MEEGKTGATEELLSAHENVGYIEKLCFTTCLDGNFVPGAVGTVRSIRKWYGKDQADIVVFLDKPEPNFDEFCRLNDLEAHVGSRLTALNAGSAPTTYGYNPANALILSVTGTTQPNTISYDSAGNRTIQNAGGVFTTFTWDYESRNSLLAPPSGSPLTNTYDATGLRRFDGVDSYIWDEQNVLQTRNASGGAKVSQNTDFPGYWGGLISQYNVALGGSLWYSNDISGNTRVVTNNSGVTTATYDYQAFGTSQKVTGDTNISSRFGGQYGYFQPATPSPILYVRQRWYDPATAQWLSRDPLDFDGGDPNLYRYVENNPLRWADPSGNAPKGSPCDVAKTKRHEICDKSFKCTAETPCDDLADLIETGKECLRLRYIADGICETVFDKGHPEVRENTLKAIAICELHQDDCKNGVKRMRHKIIDWPSANNGVGGAVSALANTYIFRKQIGQYCSRHLGDIGSVILGGIGAGFGSVNQGFSSAGSTINDFINDEGPEAEPIIQFIGSLL